MRHALVALVLVSICRVAPALAGIADTPLPILDPKAKTQHLYSVVGVVSQTPGFHTATYFSCTSTAKSTINVGVEVFNPNTGGLFVSDQADVAPGATHTFASLSNGGIGSVDVIGSGFSSPPTSARILATSKSVICTAFVVDGDLFTMNHLTIIAKTKQKAAN